MKNNKIDFEHTLFINVCESRCGNCGKGANPATTHHFEVLCYGDSNGSDGCGIEWMYLSTDYIGASLVGAAKRMRPDLIWVGDNDRD